MNRRFEEPWPLRRMVGHPVFWGVVTTLAVLALALWLGMQEECSITGSCETKMDQVLASKPHEIATLLGGFALVLIWVWLVVLALIAGRIARYASLSRSDGDGM